MRSQHALPLWIATGVAYFVVVVLFLEVTGL